MVVSRVRSLTAPEIIERTATGYRLALDAAEVDLWAARPVGLALAAQGRYAEALPLLDLAGDDDEVFLARLRSTAAVRGVPAALSAYEEYRADLAGRLGIDPAPALRAFQAELLHRDRPVRHGVRFDTDLLVGRTDDVEAVGLLVRDRSTRLVSVIGPGGLGKTRLAHRLAREAEQPVVHLVALAAVTVDAGVAVEIADTLGVQGSVTATLGASGPPADVIDRLVEAIGTVPSLLVLDNCEQVIAGVADVVAHLLRRTPSLTVLTTSRTPLGLTAEHVYHLPQLTTAEGVELFHRRALAARSGVQLDDTVVAELVGRLDGLPLAIELAAAKVRVMPVEEITRRLDDRFALLRGGSRDAPARHQTLLAVIDWSWNLLTTAERDALSRLSVFRAGFDLDGALAVTGTAALELITDLVDHSLIVVDERGHLRYRLLETVREFGRMHLVGSGADAEAEAALATWATALSRDFCDRVYSAEQAGQVTRLRTEEGNLVEVLRRALRDVEVAALVEIFAALSTLWTIEGSHLKVGGFASEVGSFLTAHPIPPGSADAARVTAVAVISNAIIFTGTVDAGLVAVLSGLGPGTDPGTAAKVRVMLALATADRDRQLETLEALLADADPAVAYLAAYWASHAWENAGQLDRARAAAQVALRRSDGRDGPWGEASVHAQLAGLALQSGLWSTARRHATAALGVLVAVGAQEDAGQMRAVEALVALREGDLDQADRIFDALAQEETTTAMFGHGIALICGRAEVLLARGCEEEGLAAYRHGVADLVRRSDHDRTVTGLPDFAGAEPWLMLPQAAALAAHVRAGQTERAAYLQAGLVGKARTVAGADSVWLDLPILGCVLVALGAWESRHGDPVSGADLIAAAEAFSVNRMLPSLDPDWGDPLVDPVRLADARAAYAGLTTDDLRERALTVLASIEERELPSAQTLRL